MKSAELVIIFSSISLALIVIVSIYIFKKLSNASLAVKAGIALSCIGLVLTVIFAWISNQEAINLTTQTVNTVYDRIADKVFEGNPNDVELNPDNIEGADRTINLNEYPSKEVVDWVVDKYPGVIFKKDIFLVETEVRNVSRKEEEWKKSTDASNGDIVEFQVHYKNTSGKNAENVIVSASLPENMVYVNGSTLLFNSDHVEGACTQDNTIVSDGVNTGNYEISEDGYTRFQATVMDTLLVEGTNRLITWGKVTANNEVLLDSADVYVVKK